ncbi:MAG TPA: hypothetical protein VHC45_08475 [Gaiellaceae bacterium]|nr:hypothetical protein [Gaiellaceae bacterium]HVV58384.1 hypothetical protein [Gaiellaceae bacterium]
MALGSKVRAVRRRLRCSRRGHYWIRRLDDDMRVRIFCGRCGRSESALERLARVTASHRTP